MKSVQEALYNWLTIHLVANARPHDAAARDTASFFLSILESDFGVTAVNAVKDEANGQYVVEYVRGGEKHSSYFPAELAEAIWRQIEAEPEKYGS
ncbi:MULTISPECIES: hypothetical protein [Geobacillus]|jgi:hypothetical protein|uniref:Uncharacterized protein n=2 Tax=Geobacillus thermodenitrificans TaxID=33940 RepID=A4ILW1_GEOTN|nr:MULTISPECIES: hypothetical protein [Geobacillus]ABO66315.1 Conserved hypothetical protein [Geobacillus thermodenitrificans NG80-2]ARA97290.1 hypothetical protein GD3902_04020 [Geobacillus thermodenitrificans]ARP42071.1 hypothetical protein GTHT12_00509 [Geobacillus thermodenitrificans]ATO36586.1 hypothetical protein GTID1_04720 [Geobacillus thermodenitrificans]KQB93954.1 hypothetical protein GEPA3_1002 [Geobacillus sp. PA-3]